MISHYEWITRPVDRRDPFDPNEFVKGLDKITKFLERISLSPQDESVALALRLMHDNNDRENSIDHFVECKQAENLTNWSTKLMHLSHFPLIL